MTPRKHNLIVGVLVFLLAAGSVIVWFGYQVHRVPLDGNSVSVASPVNVTGHLPDRKALAVSTNDVFRIHARSGARALVQFTAFDLYKASYRWRYCAAQSKLGSAGTGNVISSYDRERIGTDRGAPMYFVTPKSDNDVIVRASGIHLEWSFASGTNGWLYYDPNLATISVLTPDAFGKGL